MRTASSLLLAAFACRTPTKDTDTIACEGDASGECGDGVDNDRDGYFDCEDDGYGNSPDCEDGGGDSSGGGDTDGDEPLKAPDPVDRRASIKPPTAAHRVPLIETVRSDPRSVPEDGLRG